jgi:hypothetical protein
MGKSKAVFKKAILLKSAIKQYIDMKMLIYFCLVKHYNTI